jgi:hypothetical protein
MSSRRVTVIDESRATDVDGIVAGDAIRLTPGALHAALGWEPRPEGLCRGAVCVPAPGLVRDGTVDLADVAARLGRPLALDAAEGVACLGGSAGERATRLASLDAPDFTLPDLGGRPHALSDYCGRKVLLLAYASW